MLGAVAEGETRAVGLLRSADTDATAAALRRMGAAISPDAEGATIAGPGPRGLRPPDAPLDLGNSGTGARLLMGLVAGRDMIATITGDASLRARPMARVIAPLQRMGARFDGESGDKLPLTVTGAAAPTPIRYDLPVPSAQVKSAVLLAGLTARGETSIVETAPSRDHTERMLAAFGADVTVARDRGATIATLRGPSVLRGTTIAIPADPSAAAFPIVAATILEGSDILVENVLVNPLRAGLFDILRRMGGDLRFENRREAAGEPIADIRVRAAPLKGVEAPASFAPRMIDEYPILAVAAACARGETVMRGLGELRVKESDRLSATLALLENCGVAAEAIGDDLHVRGVRGVRGDARPRGGHVETRMDHRIAMSALVMGLASRDGVTIDDASMIATSYPRFADDMRALGARIDDGKATEGAGHA